METAENAKSAEISHWPDRAYDNSTDAELPLWQAENGPKEEGETDAQFSPPRNGSAVPFCGKITLRCCQERTYLCAPSASEAKNEVSRASKGRVFAPFRAPPGKLKCMKSAAGRLGAQR
jgi:hypothetical protein